jgi:hypothetical protein
MRRALAAVALGLLLAGVASAAPKAPASTPAQLLARHAPVLVLHPGERLSPVPADGFLADSDLQVRAPDGTWNVSTTPLPQAGPAARLDQRLCRAVDGPAALDCYVAAEEAHAAAPTVFGAVFRTGDRIALQYWLFYPVNIFSISSAKGVFWQSHEGDWEAVTVLLDKRERPALVGLSEHCAGARRDWKRVERRGSRPVVYVALGSHANYFTPGKKPLARSCWPSEALAFIDAYQVPLFDRAARGRTVVPIVSRVAAATPSWMAFAGTWGEDQYVSLPNFAPLRYGTGPRGPAYHKLWRQPVATVLAWPVAR